LQNCIKRIFPAILPLFSLAFYVISKAERAHAPLFFSVLSVFNAKKEQKLQFLHKSAFLQKIPTDRFFTPSLRLL
jgi:hypothetical protein